MFELKNGTLDININIADIILFLLCVGTGYSYLFEGGSDTHLLLCAIFYVGMVLHGQKNERTLKTFSFKLGGK